MVGRLTSLLAVLLSHTCLCHPTITDFYDIHEVNKLSMLELHRSRFEIALHSNLQIKEYGVFDFSHPLNGRALRICGLLLPRDVEVYLRILSSPILQNPPYNLSFGSDDRMMRHLGFVKGVVNLPKSGAAYKMIEKILKNEVASLTHLKEFYKPKQTWPTYLDNRAAYTNLWKHATNLFTVKLYPDRKKYYYTIDGEVHVYKYHIGFDYTKFQDFALLLGYWNSDQIAMPTYLREELERELNNVDRSDYPRDFFTRLEDVDPDATTTLSPNADKGPGPNAATPTPPPTEFEPETVDLEDNSEYEVRETYINEDGEIEPIPVDQTEEPLYETNTRDDEVFILNWEGGLTWDEAMLKESRRAAKVIIRVLYRTTRNMMRSHNIDVGLIQKYRTQLYRTTLYSKPVKVLRNMVNNMRLVATRYDDLVLDEDSEEILFESGSKYKSYWNLKNDSLYNKRTVADRSVQEIDQSLVDMLLFEPNRFFNKLINISGDGIDFMEVYHILLALTQETTPHAPKAMFPEPNPYALYVGKGSGGKYVPNVRSRSRSRNVSGMAAKVLEQYDGLPPNTSMLLKGRAKCLMAFLYLFGVSDTKGNVNLPLGWPRHIKKSLTLLISGISSPCGLCNTLLGFLASIGFPPVSNNIYAWESRRNEDETTVYQLISGNLYNSFLKQNYNFKANKGAATQPNGESKGAAQGPSEGANDNSEIVFDREGGPETPATPGQNETPRSIPELLLKSKDAKAEKKDKQDSPLIETFGVVDRSGYDLPLLCYLSGSYKSDELASLAYSYYIHSGIGNTTRTCHKSAQSSINRSPKNVGMMCLDAIPYVIESAKSSMKNKHDQFHDSSDEYRSKRYAEFIKKLSHMGDSDGLRMMGDFYYTGHEEGGIRRNYQQAINFWSRAAESGDASSALAIAHHHLSNLSTDDSGHSAMQAERYLRMVINSSSPNTSSFSTANFYLYRHGLGQPRDAALAARYLRESADRGDVNSMVLMGHAYAGILTDVTPPEGRNIFMSFYYYRRAAQSNNIVGLFNSAVFTLHGYDLEYTNALDRCNEAYKLFSRVARMGTMSTALKVLSKRAKHNNDKIGYVLMNMMMSELGDSNAHRELTKYFKTNSVFCYTQHLDPDITAPSTLYSSKNTSNSNDPITFKKFQTFQNLQNTGFLDAMETSVEPTPHNSALGNMGTMRNIPSGQAATTATTPGSSPRPGHTDRNEVNRMSREIHMLNMVRVTELPDDPEPDLRTRGMWSRDEPQNVSIFETLIRSSRPSRDGERPEEAPKVSGTKGASSERREPGAENVQRSADAAQEAGSRPEGSCYYFYSRRGAYSPQNSTPLLLAEALLSGRPFLPSEALFWAKRSKESDSLKGSYMYATMLEAGIGAPRNCQAAFGIFKDFLSSKSRGERILGLVCILRNRIISKLRRPHFLRALLVRLLYDSYAHPVIASRAYTPCDFAFLELDRLPPVGLHILTVLYSVLVVFTVYVYVKVNSH